MNLLSPLNINSPLHPLNQPSAAEPRCEPAWDQGTSSSLGSGSSSSCSSPLTSSDSGSSSSGGGSTD